VLAVLVTGGALAGAQSPPADDRPHLLLVPHTPEGRAALDRGDARVIARYEEFTLAEAAGGADARLRHAGADRRDDMREVSLPAAELDPKAERASLAAKEAPERDEALAVVQFIGPVKESWLERLEATGARVVQYAAQNAYVVHARGDALARVERLVGTDTAVRAVAPVRARDKVEDALTRGDTRSVAVQTIAGPAGAGARREALAAGPRVRAESQVGELRTQFLELDGAEAATLATDPAVVAIVPYGEPRLLDERAAQIVAGNLTSGGAPSGPGYLGWLSGKGFPSTTFANFTIDVTDEGLDNGSAPWHSDFYEDGNGSGAGRVDYATDYTSDPTARDCGGHGTNVASIAAGFGTGTGSTREDGAGFKHGIGVAPRARIGASKIFNCAGQFDYFGSFTGVVSDTYAAGARISNNSWGFSDRGSYSPDSQEYDALVRDAQPQPGIAGNQEMVEVFAAGNEGDEVTGGGNEGYGSVGSPATAKNVIAVGASESVREIGGEDGCGASDAEADDAGDIINFSSRGPTDDLRVKPDLVAPGTHVAGAAPQHGAYDGNGVCNKQFPAGNVFYSLVSGSSQAAPEVAGAAALIRSWYSRPSVGGAAPSPALTKAILANTATDLQGGDNGKGALIEGAPNHDQGWGRVDMGEVLDSVTREYYDQSTTLATSGDSFLKTYEVADSARPLKVTLAWTDAPGMVDADADVNNLDLVVEAGGRTYKGNVLGGGQSIPGGSADPRNNLESVILPSGTSGRFAVKVVGTNIPGDGVPGNADPTDQDFALVVSNATEQPPSPVLVHEQAVVDDSPAGDGDGALESGEPFELDEQLRNAADGDATGVAGTLSGGSGVTITEGSSSWPGLAAGTTATNVPPSFAGELSPGVSCGADVTATLALTTDQGSHTVPLTLPTGVGAPPTARSSSDVSKSIPDDNAGGVTSTLSVSTAGRIKDVDVHLAELDHTWVGDVRVDLTAPDGTTVNLVEHPGGPDNWTDDPGTPVVETDEAFVSTIFDDEAVSNISDGSEPYTGSFRPQRDQLARFDGKQQQGTWTLRVRDLFEMDTGTLRAWGTNTSRAACNFDTSLPDSTIDSGPNGTGPNASFTFSSNEDGATFECRLDGEAFATCSSPHSYTGLADGAHTFEVRARDGSDNVGSPDSHTWNTDLPPDTSIASGPSGTTGSRDASFTFSSSQSGSSFECSLDGGPASPCSSPHILADLSEGGHTLAVQARDSTGNLDPSPATYAWTVDLTPPALAVTSPVAGQSLTDAAPGLAGAAGTAAGDAGTVSVKVWSGTLAAGLPAQTLVVPRDPGSGAWTASPAAMGDGTWTVRAEQSDAVGNIGMSAPVTFGIDTTAPDFAIAPAEERLSDAVAGRLTVLAGCASACRVSAKLTAPATTARRLGLTAGARASAQAGRGGLADARAATRGSAAARSVLLGSSSARVSANRARALRVRLSRRARRALRGARPLKATLSVHVSAGGRAVSLRRSITLHRRVGLRRIARSGLRLAGACSEACTMRGGLVIDARTARRLGLKASGGGPLTVASGTAPVSSTGSRLTLRLTRSARGAVLRARMLTLTLEALVSGATGPEQRAAGRLTLRR
jgi:subtilisin-like proprotein convertase family protein